MRTAAQATWDSHSRPIARLCAVPGVVNVPPHEYTGPPPAGRSTLTTPDPAGKPLRYGPGAGKNARREERSPEARRWAKESRMTWNITLTLTITNIYHTANARATGGGRRFHLRAGGGPCQPSNRRIQNSWRKTPPAHGPPMLPMVKCLRSTGPRRGDGWSR